MNFLNKLIVIVCFLMIVPIEVFAWPAGLVRVKVSDPNLFVLANNTTHEIVIMVKAPVKRGNIYTDEAYNAIKSSARCKKFTLSKDRKTVMATNCVKNGTILNMYAPIINREMRMVLYSPTLGLNVAKKVSRQ